MPRILPVLEVARELIGASLVRRIPDGNTISAMLTEVDAYEPIREPSAVRGTVPFSSLGTGKGDGPRRFHASKGRTPCTEVMFGPASVFYVYLISRP